MLNHASKDYRKLFHAAAFSGAKKVIRPVWEKEVYRKARKIICLSVELQALHNLEN